MNRRSPSPVLKDLLLSIMSGSCGSLCSPLEGLFGRFRFGARRLVLAMPLNPQEAGVRVFNRLAASPVGLTYLVGENGAGTDDGKSCGAHIRRPVKKMWQTMCCGQEARAALTGSVRQWRRQKGAFWRRTAPRTGSCVGLLGLASPAVTACHSSLSQLVTAPAHSIWWGRWRQSLLRGRTRAPLTT